MIQCDWFPHEVVRIEYDDETFTSHRVFDSLHVQGIEFIQLKMMRSKILFIDEIDQSRIRSIEFEFS